MPLTISDTELNSILAEVESELSSVFKNEGARLAKAKEDGSDDDSAPPASAGDSGPPGDSSASASPAPDASAPPGGAPPGAADGSAPPADASAPAADPAQDQGGATDVASLSAQYAQLPPDQLEMHYVACKQAMMQVLSSQSASAGSPDASAPAGPSAPPAGPSASPPPDASAGMGASPSAPPGPPADMPPTQKGEMKAGKQLPNSSGNGGQAMKKSEEFLALEAKNLDLEKQVEGLAKAVTLVLQKPERKAITSLASVSFLGKTEAQTSQSESKPLSKSDVLAKLSDKARDAKLAKSDRTLINKFCVGEADLSQIAHLLK